MFWFGVLKLFDTLHVDIPNSGHFPDCKSWIAGQRPLIPKISAFILAHVAELKATATIRHPSMTPIVSSWFSPALEARACEDAVNFAIELDFRFIHVEGTP
ncbi:hypothetical protein V6N12_044773 [Hibiscus sabdariffa]|uniref:Uncharacterized protein n=1 Tax=Hibiscus sabdariffa TaxID=183260 RepID=A0ABR2BAT7_9ROSI